MQIWHKCCIIKELVEEFRLIILERKKINHYIFIWILIKFITRPGCYKFSLFLYSTWALIAHQKNV